MPPHARPVPRPHRRPRPCLDPGARGAMPGNLTRSGLRRLPDRGCTGTARPGASVSTLASSHRIVGSAGRGRFGNSGSTTVQSRSSRAGGASVTRSPPPPAGIALRRGPPREGDVLPADPAAPGPAQGVPATRNSASGRFGMKPEPIKGRGDQRWCVGGHGQSKVTERRELHDHGVRACSASKSAATPAGRDGRKDRTGRVRRKADGADGRTPSPQPGNSAVG